MFYIGEQIISESIIEKSRFIAIITPLDDSFDLALILKSIKKQYPKANHYCSAYITPMGTGSSDDGEPSGTAGVPILDILNKYDLRNVYAVVVRYFGGIKLGAGGLIRAYAGITNQALSLAKLLKKVTTKNYRVTFTYDKIHLMDQLFNDHIIDKAFEKDVTYTLSFMDSTKILEDNSYLLLNMDNLGQKEILVPWPKRDNV